jgi:hypothetical protein
MPEEEILMIGDLNAINEQLEYLTQAITAGNTTHIANFFRDIVIRLKIQERQMEEHKRFIPRIYTQINTGSLNTFEDGIFAINVGEFSTLYPHLLLMIPKEASIEYVAGDSKNVLRFSRISNGVTETIQEFDIYKESNTGAMVQASIGDIVPNRSVMFRFLYGQLDRPRAIILNTTGLFNETVSNLYVTSETIFGQRPSVVNYSTEAADELATKSDLKEFKDRFIFTTDNAETEAAKTSTPDGALVLQIDHD